MPWLQGLIQTGIPATINAKQKSKFILQNLHIGFSYNYVVYEQLNSNHALK